MYDADNIYMQGGQVEKGLLAMLQQRNMKDLWISWKGSLKYSVYVADMSQKRFSEHSERNRGLKYL